MKSLKTTAVAVFSTLLVLASLAFGQATANPKFPANANGAVMADEFGKWAFQSQTGISSGAQTVTLNGCYIKVGTSYEQFYPIAVNVPLYITDGTNSEAVTPTSVTQPTVVTGPSTVSPYNCTFTATFANSHPNPGFYVSSNDGGLEEAMNYALGKGIGPVVIESTSGITNAQLVAALPYPQVQLVDYRGPSLQYWNPQPSALTALATPAVRVGTASQPCTGSNTVCDGTAVGTWSNAAVYFCVTYVDILGGESPCSTTAHYTTAGSLALNFLAPAASTGAVGWRAYAGASYATAYQLPITSANCTLTALETVLPACAVTNALYGQTGSLGVFPTPTTHTQIPPQAGGVAAAYNPNTLSHTTFAYAPSPKPFAGIPVNYGPFTISGALTAGQSVVIGTVSLPAGYLNYLNNGLRITGKLTTTFSTGGSIQLLGSIGDITDFSTGTPKAVCTFTSTGALTTVAYDVQFQCDVMSNATGTTGTLMPDGFLIAQVAATTTAAEVDVESATGAITIDTLDQDQLFIVFLQTSAAESTTPPQLQSLHIDVL